MANIIKRVWNQNRMVQIEDLRGMTFQAEAAGHTFQISGIDDDGNTVALTGTPSGVLLRPDNTDVALTCSVSGSVVSATLPANCYDVPGRFGLTIFITSGSSKTAIYAAVGTVTRTSSGTVAPGTSQSVVDLINAINAAVNSIPASYSALLADIAPTYSNSALYSVGQYAWYDGDLKRCIVPITTAESYTAAHWTSAVLGQDVSDLKSAIGDISENTRNLANFANVRIGEAWNGAINSARATLYIQVESNTRYTLSFNSITSFDLLTWYEKASESATTTTAAYTISNNDNPATLRTKTDSAFIVFQFNKTNISEGDFANLEFQLEEGSVATPYIRPVSAVDALARERISALESDDVMLNAFYDGQNLFDERAFTPNKEINSSGDIIDSDAAGVGDYIPVVKGKTLYFSMNGTAISSYQLYFMAEYNANKTFLNRANVGTLQSYTPPDNVKYVRPVLALAVQHKLKIEYDGVTPWSKSMTARDVSDSEIMATVNMFGSIAGVGDSYTAGLSVHSDGSASDQREQSYIATLGKRAGIDWSNYGVSGATTKTYQTVSGGLSAVLADTPKDLYIFALGQNDVNVGTTEGSISDIHDDWTLNADTFYGNYGKIISQIKNHAPNAKMIMVKSWLNTNKYGTDISYQMFDNAIEAIAAYYQIPCIAPFDDRFFNSRNYQGYRVQGHPTTMGYAMMGVAMERLISNCIMENPQYFLYSTVG